MTKCSDPVILNLWHPLAAIDETPVGTVVDTVLLEEPVSLAVDEAGRAGDGLWAVGPLTKGKWWEITAVPDIRVQVEEVAQRIAD